MGLDNGFVLRSKSNPNMVIEVAYFRKFYELNNYVMANGEKVDDYTVSVSYDLMEKLYAEISPITRELNALKYKTVFFYDENGYPPEWEQWFFGEQFSPCDTNTSFFGTKLMKLGKRLECMMEILDNDDNNDLYFEFYSSY